MSVLQFSCSVQQYLIFFANSSASPFFSFDDQMEHKGMDGWMDGDCSQQSTTEIIILDSNCPY
jgi:hypothetical protein